MRSGMTAGTEFNVSSVIRLGYYRNNPVDWIYKSLIKALQEIYKAYVSNLDSIFKG